jgi:hypothetical protein
MLSLLAIPSDYPIAPQPLSHPDFSTSTGYICRAVNGAPVHAIDWNGEPGADSLLRENGPRSGPLWREFGKWRTHNPDAGLKAHGDEICRLLLHYFGPYDRLTAEALSKQRELQIQKMQVSAELNSLCPPQVVAAARDYLGISTVPVILSHLPLLPTFGHQLPTPLAPKSPHQSSEALPEKLFARLEIQLRELLLGMPASHDLSRSSSLDEVARALLQNTQSFQNELDELDRELLNLVLPAIPGEHSPADLDLIPYGRLICRHRAVIAAVPLANAGFAVELVVGSREDKGVSVPHIFVFNEELGILEASSNGPHFWIGVATSTGSQEMPTLRMADGSTYQFHRRILLSSH